MGYLAAGEGKYRDEAGRDVNFSYRKTETFLKGVVSMAFVKKLL